MRRGTYTHLFLNGINVEVVDVNGFLDQGTFFSNRVESVARCWNIFVSVIFSYKIQILLDRNDVEISE
jgi:hypothetical protein